MTHPIRDLKKRLRDLVGAFKYEHESSKAKGREFYRLAKDALDLCERLERELHDLRNPKLPTIPPRPYVAPSSEPKVYLTREERLRAMISGGPSDPVTMRYLRFHGRSYGDVLKELEELEQERLRSEAGS